MKNKKLNGSIVTDGKNIFTNYEWRDGQIWNRKRNKKMQLTVSAQTIDGVHYKHSTIHLTLGNKQVTRSFEKLMKCSFPEQFFPQDLDKWVDVFGYEDQYCFNPANPNQIWSKTRKQLIKLSKNNNRHSCHLLFNVFKDGTYKTHYVHIMVWQSYHKMKLPKGFVLHHLNHDSFCNTNQNLILLPKGVHSQFEVMYSIYSHKSGYYKSNISKEQFVERVENFDISLQDIERLIKSI